MKEDKILTVSELTRGIREALEGIFDQVSVEGEISNLRSPSSGHLYFTLKDEMAQLRCVLFRGAASGLKFLPHDGLRAVCRGRIGVYEKDGQYQLYVASVEPKGKGALQLAFEQLKEKLAKEGLFDEARKKPLPLLPRAVGVVTSPTGAVIHDILHVLDRRFPAAHVIVSPVRVQGEGAAEEIASALDGLNALGCVQVIILARGGGGIEDLWSFNEEPVARAIFRSAIPVVSAIGHETDYTIADFVADRRAPTPSAAAEIVMPSLVELEEKIGYFLRHLWRGLAEEVPQRSQRLDDMAGDLVHAMEQRLDGEKTRLAGILEKLETLNPLGVLRRGYSITSSLDGAVLLSAGKLQKGDRVRTRLSEGEFIGEVVCVGREILHC